MLEKILIKLFCNHNRHYWVNRFTGDDAWHECLICGKKVDFTEEEYKNLELVD